MGGVDYPRSLAELHRMFPVEDACAKHLERLRWPAGFVCRACGVLGDPWRVTGGRLVCQNCRAEARVTAGTIFDKTRTPLTTWFAAAWLVAAPKNGTSAKTLARTLGVSYRTAFVMLHRFRVAMVRSERPKLSGRVEVDETFVGGVRHGKGRGPVGKFTVAVAVEQHQPKGFGRVRMRHVPAPRAEYLLPFIDAVIEPGSLLLTDGSRAYDRIVTRGYAREAVSLATAPLAGHDYLPGVHRIASLLKRWLLGTHQGSVDPEHLQSYLEEFTFRWNRRNATHRGLVFHRLLEQGIATGPVTATDVTHGYHKPPLPEPLGDGPLRVAILEGPQVTAALVRSHLSGDGRFAIVAWHTEPETARAQVRQAQPDVIVMDAAHDLTTADELVAASPHARILVHDPHGHLDPTDIAATRRQVVRTTYHYDQLADEIAAGGPPSNVPF